MSVSETVAHKDFSAKNFCETLPLLHQLSRNVCQADAMTVRQDLQQRIDKLTPKFNSFTIGGVRIVAALLWIANVHWKVPPDFGKKGGGGLYKYTASGAQNAPFAPFRWLLRELVVPHFQLFGWFTLLGEIALAALLLAGYRTRLVGLAGAVMAMPIGSCSINPLKLNFKRSPLRVLISNCLL